MSGINECLKQIMSARFGKDVRQSIHDGIKEVDSVARAAQNSATANAQTASAKASEALQASQEALKKAQEAQESAQQAKTYAENAEAVTGVNIGTKDSAGIIKGGENHIAEDGTLELVVNTTETTMPNSRKGGLLIDEIGGVCEQVTTTGSQLFNINSLTAYGINDDKPTITVDKNKVTVKGKGAYAQAAYIVKNSTSLAGKHVSLSLNSVSSSNTKAPTAIQVMIVYADDTRTYHSVGNINLLLFEVPYNVKELQIRIVCNNSNTVLETENVMTVEGIMFNIGDDALPWEPYTDGVPSPSPEYPQEIKKSVVSEIKTKGKNLTNAQKVGTNIKLPTPLKSGTYTISFKANSGGFRMSNTTDVSKDSVAKSDSSDSEGYVKITLTTDFVTNYINISANGDTATEIMLVEGTKAIPYEPYTENIIFFFQPIELYGNGDIQDVVAEGYVKRRFKKVVFDGSSDERWVASTLAAGRYYVEGVANSKLLGVAICTHSIHSNGATTEYLNRSYFSESVDGRFIINTSFATLSEWKAHLQANPMTLVYELAEEETEELSVPYQITLNSLVTYDGITYLEFNSDVKPTSKCKYATSLVGSVALESLIKARNNESKIALLEATVVNNI